MQLYFCQYRKNVRAYMHCFMKKTTPLCPNYLWHAPEGPTGPFWYPAFTAVLRGRVGIKGRVYHDWMWFLCWFWSEWATLFLFFHRRTSAVLGYLFFTLIINLLDEIFKHICKNHRRNLLACRLVLSVLCSFLSDFAFHLFVLCIGVRGMVPHRSLDAPYTAFSGKSSR